MVSSIFFHSPNRYSGKHVGQYTIIKTVGEGRYGMCLLAHTIDDTPVIIKRFKQNIFKTNKEKNAYEAIILSQLDHTAIPQFKGVINEKNFYAFVLEQKQGTTIETMIFKNKHSFDDSEIYSIGTQLIEILKYMHHKGIVHRDIRIPNVILNENKIYLVDFGLARWADEKHYNFDYDFSYLGDFLLYLLYSSYSTKRIFKNRPWYEELPLSNEQKFFMKRLLRLEEPYKNIDEVEKDFLWIFKQ